MTSSLYFIPILCALLSVASGRNYYLDSRAGSNQNQGLTPGTALKDFPALDQFTLAPGDTIYLKRNSVWSEGLTINQSATKEQPILVTAYGSGQNPVISNSGQRSKAIEITGDWIILENITVRDAHEAGVFIAAGADHNTVRNCEITAVGEGVAVRGRYNLVTGNYIHDLKMVVNDSGGDNDYGAVGVFIFNSDNEVSYNYMENCIAPSYDYGTDGGVFELNSDNVDRNFIHHNYGINCNAVFEVSQGSARDNVIAYNIFINNGSLGGIHIGSHAGSKVENLRFENNTVIEVQKSDWMQDWELFYFDGKPSAATIIMRNNIFYLGRYFNAVTHEENFSHSHNLYFLAGGSSLGFPRQDTEIIADPRFEDLDKLQVRLLPDSPAIDMGLEFGYESDFYGIAVPQGSRPDAGACEYSPTDLMPPAPPRSLRVIR